MDVLSSSYFFESTEYWSEGDETAHFAWLRRIPCIREIKGSGTRVYLRITDNSVTDNDFRELIAVYRRYGGDIHQLAPLALARNS
jgi:hypothetical protein